MGKARVKLVLPGLRVCEVQPGRSTHVRAMAITTVIPGVGRGSRIRSQDGAGRGQCKGATFHRRGNRRELGDFQARPDRTVTRRGQSSSDQVPGWRRNDAESSAEAGSFSRRWSCSGKKLAALPNRKQGMPAFWGGGYSPLPGRDAEPLLLISIRLCMKRRIIQEPGIVPGSGKQ